ncbi:MAG: hypothetical protein RR439_05270 [Carnobacterium sp.]
MKQSSWMIVKLIIFIVSVGLVIYGQRTTGKMELGIMLIGLTGLLGLLYNYNQKYV